MVGEGVPVMKKRFILLFSFIMLSSFLFPMELDFSWDTGAFFVSGQLDFKQKPEPLLNGGARVGSVNFYDNDSGLGLVMNPFVWNCELRFSPESSSNYFSFLNLELFYDLFRFNKDNMILGPYCSVNYLDLINMRFSHYQGDLGFKFSFCMDRGNLKWFRPEAVIVRTGLRVRNNQFSTFIEGGINIGGFVMGVINSKYSEAKDIKGDDDFFNDNQEYGFE